MLITKNSLFSHINSWICRKFFKHSLNFLISFYFIWLQVWFILIIPISSLIDTPLLWVTSWKAKQKEKINSISLSFNENSENVENSTPPPPPIIKRGGANYDSSLSYIFLCLMVLCPVVCFIYFFCFTIFCIFCHLVFCLIGFCLLVFCLKVFFL